MKCIAYAPVVPAERLFLPSPLVLFVFVHVILFVSLRICVCVYVCDCICVPYVCMVVSVVNRYAVTESDGACFNGAVSSAISYYRRAIQFHKAKVPRLTSPPQLSLLLTDDAQAKLVVIVSLKR